jgi:hypothetical protein
VVRARRRGRGGVGGAGRHQRRRPDPGRLTRTTGFRDSILVPLP